MRGINLISLKFYYGTSEVEDGLNEFSSREIENLTSFAISRTLNESLYRIYDSAGQTLISELNI